MADDLIKEWEKLQLTEDENVVIGFLPPAVTTDENNSSQLRMALVEKLCTVKPFNVDAMKKTLANVWRLNDDIVIKMLDTNLFIFQFSSEDDKQQVVDGMPWFFDDKLLLLGEINGNEQPSEITINRNPMWVRLIDVPFNKRSHGVLKEIGDSLGGFLELDKSDPLSLGKFVRIKVMVDVHKPLRRGLFLATGGSKPKWIDIKFERLSDSCYYCGLLDHTDKECEKKETEEGTKAEVVYQYGPWMRASPLKIT
ncbi:uncharacterized protein LOC110692445 [Chenopodium quinoa]|uniref:uncharacterized protein LOC110692445 n=1 Tax=Chenopodium quinoa TaxID=63459 RepID=UPI000B770D56|nr:uncharacterized protein LOC110692445 [Chenopodium quinoa]